MEQFINLIIKTRWGVIANGKFSLASRGFVRRSDRQCMLNRRTAPHRTGRVVRKQAAEASAQKNSRTTLTTDVAGVVPTIIMTSELAS